MGWWRATRPWWSHSRAHPGPPSVSIRRIPTPSSMTMAPRPPRRGKAVVAEPEPGTYVGGVVLTMAGKSRCGQGLVHQRRHHPAGPGGRQFHPVHRAGDDLHHHRGQGDQFPGPRFRSGGLGHLQHRRPGAVHLWWAAPPDQTSYTSPVCIELNGPTDGVTYTATAVVKRGGDRIGAGAGDRRQPRLCRRAVVEKRPHRWCG